MGAGRSTGPVADRGLRALPHQDQQAHDSDTAIDRLVTARIERQAILASDHPLMLWYVIDEGVLHDLIGGPVVMAAQLDRLIEAAGTPGIVIQVLPFTADHAGTDGPISVYEFAEAPAVCYTECCSGGRIVEARGGSRLDDGDEHSPRLRPAAPRVPGANPPDTE